MYRFATKLMPLLALSNLLLSWACSHTQTQELAARSSAAASYKPQERVYYVAAEAVTWNYAPSGKNLLHESDGLGVWGEQLSYQKIRYTAYTDASFRTKVPQPVHMGILGPALRAVVGDTIKVHFFNRSDRPLNMHPHGVLYDKNNEGAHYGGIPGKGQMVAPGERYVYTWEVPERAGPGPRDGSSVVWLYHSHDHDGSALYKGLIGPLVIVAPQFATADARPKDVDRELFNLFMIFNENKEGEEQEKHLKHSINGFLFANIPGLDMVQHEKVRWYLMAMGNEVDLHTPHWHGETVLSQGMRKDVVELLPASMLAVDMQPENVGTWMYHCHVVDHIRAGMSALFTIRAASPTP